MVLYSAVSSPLDRSKRFTLSSPGRPVHSDTVLGFSWKHSPNFETVTTGIRTRALSIASPAFYQLSYRAPPAVQRAHQPRRHVKACDVELCLLVVVFLAGRPKYIKRQH